jgi:signal transduction histidine kinase/PAS domain-containing protein
MPINEERYRAFIAHSSEGIWCFETREPVPIDLPVDEQIERYLADAYLCECNEAFAQMYGYARPEEMMGTPLTDMLVRDDPKNIEHLRAFIESGYRLTDAESTDLDRDGNEKSFLNNLTGIIVDGRLVRAWGTQRDVTAQRDLETERHALLNRAEFLSDASAALGSSLDYDTTLHAVADAAVPRFSDWCYVDVIDHDAIPRIVIRHSDPAKMKIARDIESLYPARELSWGSKRTARTGITQTFEVTENRLGEAARNGEHLAMLLSLGIRWCAVVPLIARGKVLGALTFAHGESGRTFSAADLSMAEDLGRRAGLAFDHARLYRELEQAGRAKDEFLAVLSHELRTPMTVALGWAAMLQMDGSSPDSLPVALDAIVRSLKAQATLIDDIYDLSRIVAGKMDLSVEDVSLTDVVLRAVATMRNAADAKELTLEVDARDDVRILGDAPRLQQVFWNLLSNAVKFTPRRGTVSISVDHVEADTEVNTARVIVRDTGEGIEPAFFPYLFERFRQAERGMNRKFGGLGLGLSIARNLVELHGGSVSAYSEGHGKGSAFTVTLPRRASVYEHRSPVPAARAEGQ